MATHSSNNDETAYMEELENLALWCQENCLYLNISKTKKLVVDFSMQCYMSLKINKTEVERVMINKGPVQKGAAMRLYHLRQLRRFGVTVILKAFYSGAVESILIQNITSWFGNICIKNCKALHGVVWVAERCTRSALTSPQDIYTRRCKNRAIKIIQGLTYLSNCLLDLLKSGKCYGQSRKKQKDLLSL